MPDDLNSQNNRETEFTDVCDYVRKRPKSFYVGGFKNSINENKIYRHVTNRGLKLTKVSVFRSKRVDAAVVRVNIEDDSNVSLIDDPLFWPKGVVCRPWVSRYKSKRYGGNRSRGNKYNDARASEAKSEIVYFDSQSEYIVNNPFLRLSPNRGY